MKKFFLIGLAFALFVVNSFALDLSVGGGFTGGFSMGWLETTATGDPYYFGTGIKVQGRDFDKRFGVKANIAIDYAELSLGYSHLTREQTIVVYTKPAGDQFDLSVDYHIPDEMIIAALFTAEFIGKYPFGQENDLVRFEPFLGVGMDYVFWGKASSTLLNLESNPPQEGVTDRDLYLNSGDLVPGGTADSLYDNDSRIYSRIRAIAGVGIIIKLADKVNLNPRLACDYAFYNFAGSEAKLGTAERYFTFSRWSKINFTARMDVLLDFKLLSF